MRSLRFTFVLLCLGCEATPPASDATTDTTASDTTALDALDVAATDALDATLADALNDARDAFADTRDALDDTRDATIDARDALVVADVRDASPCPTATQRACNGACIDTSFDDLNCGACDLRCGAGTNCRMGRCIPACLTGEEICNACDPNRANTTNCGG